MIKLIVFQYDTKKLFMIFFNPSSARPTADELFKFVWPFCGVGASAVKLMIELFQDLI